MDLALKGKRALVTGGTKGIGRAIAFTFAAEGADVAICARDAKAVAATVTELKAVGVKAFGAALDVGNGEALRGFVSDAASALGGLDAVVANASALSSGASEEAFGKAYDIDLMHTRNLAEAALPFLENSGQASFCAISSVSGEEDYGYGSVSYGTMKAALFFYVKSLARHVAPKGIRANIVSPGTTYFKEGYWHKVEHNDPERFARNLAENPMGRMATPEEIANVVVFLAGAPASFVSGTNISVDGTLTIRIPN
jgi:NAD(P)-dependent dehydrogenase (short-subunit alcohol dehydrogenase family)